MSTADVTTLASTLTLPCGQTLPNRFAKAAMSEQLGDFHNRPTPALATLYREWGAGGCGLLLTGNVMVDRRHVGEPRNVVVEDERDLAALTKWAQAGREHGAKIWVQINHPGRQALRIAGSHPVAPSAIAPKIPAAATPHALTAEQIEEILQRFVTTASVVQAAGFDGVQLHGAHGYLISQFLSPASNVRDDEWGGDPERRRHFVLELMRRVRAAVGPDFPIAIKLNSADFQRGGTTEAESTEVVISLADAGVDLVEISGGTYEAPAMTGARQSTLEREAYFLRYAEEIRDKVPQLPLMVTGGFRTREAMANALASGACDLIGVARPLAIDTRGPAQLLQGSLQRLPQHQQQVGGKQLDAAIDLFWHTRQIQRIGHGKEPQAGAGTLRTAALMLLETGIGSLRRKRGG